MHYADIRDRVWAAADYAPAGSPEAVARTREFINRALARIALDAPFLFERDISIYLDPDVRPDNTDVADTWESTTPFDPWVIRSTWNNVNALALYNRFVNNDRPFNGWYFECRDPADSTSDRVLVFRIREVWTEEDPATGRHVHISFFEPNPYDTPGFSTAAGGVGVISDWRITVRQYALPQNVIEIQSVRPYDASNDFGTFRYITAEDASCYGYEGGYWDETVTSMPWVFWSGTVETLTNMNVAPNLGGSLGAWSTAAYAEPKGDFEYLYTLSLGERHDEVQDINPTSSPSVAANASGRRSPYIESPPSAIAGPTFSTSQIVVTLPNYPALVGFEDVATRRYRRVGVKANIYRRRVGVDPAYALPYPTSNHFQHIASVDFSNGSATYTDDGTSVPGRRLCRVGGYKTLRFSHAPDKRYRLRVRCVVRPEEILDDSDACEIPPSAIDALIFLSLRNLYEASGNPSMAAYSFADYERALHALKKRHASLKPTGESWRMRSRSAKRWKRGYRHHDIVDTP